MANKIEIRLASFQDSEGVHEIIQHWYNNYFKEDNSQGHMYSENTWSLEDIIRTINESYISIAFDNEKNKVASLYLINTFLEIGNVSKRTLIIDKMVIDKKLPFGRYAYSLAAATHKDYLGLGLNRKVLNHLRRNTAFKYDYFAGIMSYDNYATQKSGKKMGWQYFGDIGIGLLGVIGTTSEKNLQLIEFVPET